MKIIIEECFAEGSKNAFYEFDLEFLLLRVFNVTINKKIERFQFSLNSIEFKFRSIESLNYQNSLG